MPWLPWKWGKSKSVSTASTADDDAQSQQGVEPDSRSDAASQTANLEEDLAEILQGDLPAWFLDHCVQSYEQTCASTIPLVIGDAKGCDDLNQEAPGKYQIDPVLYGSLASLIDAKVPPLANGEAPEARRSTFAHDAAILRVAVHAHQHSGEEFLAAVLRQFAKDHGADILTLRHQDMSELYDVFFLARAKTEKDRSKRRHSKDDDGEGEDDDGEGKDDDGESSSSSSGSSKPDDSIFFKTAYKLLFAKLLTVTEARIPKTDTPFHESERQTRPLIVELPDLEGICSMEPFKEILAQLQEAVKAANSSGLRVIVVGLDSWEIAVRSDRYRDAMESLLEDAPIQPDVYGSYGTSQNESLLSMLGSNPLRPVLPLLPAHTKVQRSRFGKHGANTQRAHNIRALQLKIRNRTRSHGDQKLLEPYCFWDLPEESHCFKTLSHSEMNSSTLEFAAAAISTNISIDHILQVFQGLGALRDQIKPIKEEEKSKYSQLHPEAQKAIAEINQNPDKYQWEGVLLDQLVSPDDVNQGWSAIEVEEDVKQAITQMLDLANSNPDLQAGILRNSRINGVLLYGPPGTGKTHLARVLAHEYGAVMIHVSAAELENKYVGETEKAIKGLFNLAAMVYPSIIFIDEADSLFRKRQPDDYDWTRSRLNTLLAQTDGLIKTRRQPFLLIATNHPGDLDEAILRRVPSRLYIGLPSTSARESMLNIFLREEELDPKLRLRDVAARTTGFTGSDLHTVCVQAALIGQAEQRKSGGEQARRVLKHGHFEEALGRCGPTVSDSAMEAIREFAEKFDPSAGSRLGPSRKSASAGPAPSKHQVPPKRTRGVSASDVPPVLKNVQPPTNGEGVNGYEEWKTSEMYPYVTEELCQKWWSGESG
ncbi:unnamed protein product [Clonostachys solani]|uniref:AAA+ ATPase domain-containing protein n=1 Tax=Clonostachys solani TaxID=160281 RepID=A0A9N9Z4U0_9HYPO|nr:unnamed protein product [Clonostachys solani]